MEWGSWHCTGDRDQDHPPMVKKCKKAKWLSGETLQIAVKRREAKSKGEKERYSIWMQNSKEQQEEIRKPSSVINAKKWRKRTEWERLEISSRKLEIPREWSIAKANRVLPRECTGHSKYPLPTTQEKTLHMDITRWSTPKSDWLYSLQPKMEKLYTVNKNKTRSWLWLRSWTPYYQIQTEIEESRENR